MSMNINIILLPSTTAAATSPSTCEPVLLEAPGKRQRVTKQKVLHCCVVYQENDQSAVQLARRGETPRAVLVLLKGLFSTK